MPGCITGFWIIFLVEGELLAASEEVKEFFAMKTDFIHGVCGRYLPGVRWRFHTGRCFG
jgi:hypothetical protein